MSTIQNKIVVIMGASSGIGEATTKRLAEEGAKLVIAARREDRLKALVESLPNADISYAVVDVTNKDDVQAVIDLAVEKYGRVDVLFNNAEVMPHSPLSETRFDEWRQMLDVNIMGVLNGIAAVLPIMKKQQSGQIVTTDSVAGHVVFQQGAVYCGTKFAVRAIMEGLRQEERENNIRSTLISPGTVDTELHTTINNPKRREWVEDLQRTIGLQSSDIADAIAYAISTPETVAVSEIIIRPTKQVD
ncbi:SDR family oxidoreductase [Priestia endophytica]|jgi:NADP-dependent 3-hydroxy acid dehydrogenase YdfG|uniref:glucose 1-dehydrogenase [NAD(P)(+)] n=1 Tax=Priestia endophytica DSM 13796 TaxID=1121089 RepID=A0A1I6BAG4_9BACI|nr:SDR family oxidoreductase [Priestia endophytica]KYG26116.1 oxidoreductase [Priestia endophytica]MBG9813740.1 oxidoreductase [Priestia endophytica]SFQ77928.1 NADP-dependent 3-hydroxy acid dehydrogenase YdfG [Priestia endophytica DSM 13796]